MVDHCGTITEDGNAVCIPGTCNCSSETKSSAPILLSLPAVDEHKSTFKQFIAELKKAISLNHSEEKIMWKKIRSALAFGVACVASPCCTPLIVPLGLALLAGTPVAVWASANLGWVYGGLTLISIASFVLAYRWMGQKSASKPTAAIQPIQEINRT